MEYLLYTAMGILAGFVIGWLIAKASSAKRYSALEKEFVGYKATAIAQEKSLTDHLTAKTDEAILLQQKIDRQVSEISSLSNQIATSQADLKATHQLLKDKDGVIIANREETEKIKAELNETHKALATANATNEALQEKLQTQKEAIENLNTKFATEFENVANKLLDSKSEKFTALNRDNLTHILQPLGEKITEFKKQVEDTYGKESNERASLKTEVKNLLDMNQVLASEAKNLTRALKAEVKTQGRWGEMILEKILDKSGLRKGEEFFMEHQLFGEDGKPLLSAVTGKKMRPDALIKYPDERHVIVDSKVSLNAFIRMVEAEDETTQQAEMVAHVKAIKCHIDELSIKAYDDYSKAMDFVMMFVPNESAYFAALQGDSNLWEYAYDRRILLISPTNLIAALKLISDLWKRERNEGNAMAIADRAVKMYEKMVGFVDSLDAVGKNIDLAKGKFDDAVKQLYTGRDNFFGQAAKMKVLLNYQRPKDFSPERLDLGRQNDETDNLEVNAH